MAGSETGLAYWQRVAARKAQQRGDQPADSAGALEQLLWEQRQANKMLWLMLSDEQKSQFSQMQ
jgi:hypothetical protein